MTETDINILLILAGYLVVNLLIAWLVHHYTKEYNEDK